MLWLPLHCSGRYQVAGSALSREILLITCHWPKEPGGRCCMTVLSSTRHLCVLKGALTAKALPGLETTRICIKRDSRGRFCWQGEGQLQPKDGTISRQTVRCLMETSTTVAEHSSRTQLDHDGSNIYSEQHQPGSFSCWPYRHGEKKPHKSKDNTALKADGQGNFYTRNLKLSFFPESNGVVGQPSDGNKLLLTLGLVCL